MLIGQYRDHKGKWVNIPTIMTNLDPTALTYEYCKQQGLRTRVIDSDGVLDEKGVKQEKIVREFRCQKRPTR